VTACNCPQKHPDHACPRAKSSRQSGQQRQTDTTQTDRIGLAKGSTMHKSTSATKNTSPAISVEVPPG